MFRILWYREGTISRKIQVCCTLCSFHMNINLFITTISVRTTWCIRFCFTSVCKICFIFVWISMSFFKVESSLFAFSFFYGVFVFIILNCEPTYVNGLAERYAKFISFFFSSLEVYETSSSFYSFFTFFLTVILFSCNFKFIGIRFVIII